MNRLLELLLGLQRGFLNREGDLSIQFNPRWPGQNWLGASTWNTLFVIAIIALVFAVYRREGKTNRLRYILALIRATLLALLLILLNRPMVNLGQSRTEPSVLAILVDDSLSMKVPDAGADRAPVSRLNAVKSVLTGNDAELLRNLEKKHVVRCYDFDSDAHALIASAPNVASPNPKAVAEPHSAPLSKLQPTGQSTEIVPSLLTVLQDLQGQRVAGIVLLTDGRDTPLRTSGDQWDELKSYGVKIFPVPVGSNRPVQNIAVQSVNVEETAFQGDIVNIKAMVQANGYEPGHEIKVMAKDAKTGHPLMGLDGQPLQQMCRVVDTNPVEVELQLKASDLGPHEVAVEAEKQPGELDETDNSRELQYTVLDAKLSVLYVDGYPRWEYRYLKNEMIRDKTVDISCLLSSADAGFAQEGDKPIRRFPQSIEELMEYDVVVFGDVDPRYFTDAQLQLVSDFVSRKGGGFAMIAGPRWSPQAFENTAIEPILPVAINRVQSSDSGPPITQGFRPVLTRVGAASSIFRFFADPHESEQFVATELQPLFWYCRGVTVKPGVGEVYAEHPSDQGPDGRKAPILVLGRYGAGRTLFSAIDDSWRWRFYTGESIFDTYWIEQLRYLARSRKIGQRKMTFVAGRSVYDQGQQVRLTLRILDPILLQQLPDQVKTEMTDSTGQRVGYQLLSRSDPQSDVFTGSFPADQIGKFTITLPPLIASADKMSVPVEVSQPRLELVDPVVDNGQLGKLASETSGKLFSLAHAAEEMKAIPSAAKILPVNLAEPLWDAPIVMILFVVLIGGEWIARKAFGMI